MGTILEYKDRVAFHPGHYIKKFIDYNGFTEEDFAERLGTTPKNLSILIRGEQGLSLDIAVKLGRLTATSVDYWLNHQKAYDSLMGEMMNDRLSQNDEEIMKELGYSYFRDNFKLENHARKLGEQCEEVRTILDVSSLSSLTEKKSFPFRSSGEMSETNILKANAMVYLAMNATMRTDASAFDRIKFEKAVDNVLNLTTDYDGFCDEVRSAFLSAGVVLTVLPNIPGSRLRGASGKVGKKAMLMVSDHSLTSDVFWFTLIHEARHIVKRDWGVSFVDEKDADRYAEDKLIPPDKYRDFFIKRKYDSESIVSFASGIKRDPGIVVARLQKDGACRYDDSFLNSLKHRCTLTQDLSLCISPFALKCELTQN